MAVIMTSFDKTADPTNIYQIWFARGAALANSGHYREALANLDKAVTIREDDPSSWVLRAVVLVHLERYSEALSSCEKALELDSKHQEAWLIRGAALHYLGRYQQSYTSYNKALGINRQSWWQRITQTWYKLRGIQDPDKMNKVA
ncbi:hypothetical protein NIES1031_01170 [Chroogloeocystis siderophila 5.2 s.c.1]|jgi:tetratricopeptide (TPR) repeat protein|uniref:Uncharacterized protein n=2 Tax=Chroogloeocystis TaxID=329162 RepID=A0A1U7I044_9CHRO|nr:hypothetical protein NIES1031_01170 [Chroogloeocystis siderophila 5.2 s.c.1]